MIRKFFPDSKCFACVFLTAIAAALVLIDTTGIMSLVGIGIAVGVFLGNLMQS